MLQAGGELDLAQEALGSQGMREFRVQYLDGDEPLVSQILRKVDRGRPPTSDLTLEDVASGENVVQYGRDIDHCSTGTGNAKLLYTACLGHRTIGRCASPRRDDPLAGRVRP